MVEWRMLIPPPLPFFTPVDSNYRAPLLAIPADLRDANPRRAPPWRRGITAGVLQIGPRRAHKAGRNVRRGRCVLRLR